MKSEKQRVWKRNNYLNNFDDEAEGYGEGCQDEQQGDEGDEVKLKK